MYAFLIAAAVLFLALLAGTAMELPRSCSEEWSSIELSQTRLLLSSPCCRRALSPSSRLRSDYLWASERFTKSGSLAAGSDAFCHPARNPA
jgi:hypothetical protein